MKITFNFIKLNLQIDIMLMMDAPINMMNLPGLSGPRRLRRTYGAAQTLGLPVKPLQLNAWIPPRQWLMMKLYLNVNPKICDFVQRTNFLLMYVAKREGVVILGQFGHLQAQVQLTWLNRDAKDILGKFLFVSRFQWLHFIF